MGETYRTFSCAWLKSYLLCFLDRFQKTPPENVFLSQSTGSDLSYESVLAILLLLTIGTPLILENYLASHYVHIYSFVAALVIYTLYRTNEIDMDVGQCNRSPVPVPRYIAHLSCIRLHVRKAFVMCWNLQRTSFNYNTM